jgi:3-oxoacyl-[acyl-carrier protein] reductase
VGIEERRGAVVTQSLEGQVVVVTGASRGIGLAIANRLAQAGARLALLGRDGPALEQATRHLPDALVEEVDVAEVAAVERFARRVLDTLGPPRGVVNNAGIVERAPLEELTESAWDAVVDVNLKGTYAVSRAFLASMKAAGGGRIVNIASISGTLGTPRLTAYCAAKHGVIGFSRALAEETRAHNVQVNAINPGSVDTDMLKGSGFPPMMQPDDIASVVEWLLVGAPRAMTGACVDVFG